MMIGTVIGNVVATVKHEAYRGRKVMIVQLLDPSGSERGDSLLAIDLVQAGEGDCVLVLEEGSGARQLLLDREAPARAVIVGVIDRVDIEEKPASRGAEAAGTSKP